MVDLHSREIYLVHDDIFVLGANHRLDITNMGLSWNCGIILRPRSPRGYTFVALVCAELSKPWSYKGHRELLTEGKPQDFLVF